jgi:hypothetical protein
MRPSEERPGSMQTLSAPGSAGSLTLAIGQVDLNPGLLQPRDPAPPPHWPASLPAPHGIPHRSPVARVSPCTSSGIPRRSLPHPSPARPGSPLLPPDTPESPSGDPGGIQARGLESPRAPVRASDPKPPLGHTLTVKSQDSPSYQLGWTIKTPTRPCRFVNLCTLTPTISHARFRSSRTD